MVEANGDILCVMANIDHGNRLVKMIDKREKDLNPILKKSSKLLINNTSLLVGLVGASFLQSFHPLEPLEPHVPFGTTKIKFSCEAISNHTL
jgi:hypothetical protein